MKTMIRNPFIYAILFVITLFVLSCQLYPGQQTVLNLDAAHSWARTHIADPSAYMVKSESFADIQIFDNPAKAGKPTFHVRKSLGVGTGSGTVIADKGYLLTAGHVIDDANVILEVNEIVDELRVKYPKTFIDAKVITEYTMIDHKGKDFLAAKVAIGENDLGLIRAQDPDKFTGTPVDVSRETNLSDKAVIMIGSPLRIKDIIMDGRVGREDITKFGEGSYKYVIAPIVPGNSGGAVITLHDMKLVGVVTAVMVKDGSFTNLALFVPNDIINNFLEKNLPK
ncbi:MAG: trypsin-like peptidase domain-containing protein [Candidatus Paceibacterota bacterium]|jgi:S1-C subfamily serine protease|nr:trypsin-like peptidase domain-containing protein [Candidatus Paceibacterota bacterium]